MTCRLSPATFCRLSELGPSVFRDGVRVHLVAFSQRAVVIFMLFVQNFMTAQLTSFDNHYYNEVVNQVLMDACL